MNTGENWPQPNGPGSVVRITYSYSNLLDGQLRGLTTAQIKQAVQEAFGLWASVAPLDFVEVQDSGPAPTANDPNYDAAGHAQIRLGHHPDDGIGGALAHAFIPFSTTAGIAGDVHFDRDENWGEKDGGLFLETCLHEIGHALGLDHEPQVDAIMNPVIAGRFDGLGEGFLLSDDIDGIRDVYGEGEGSVTPLDEEDMPPENPDETPDEMPDTPEDQPPAGVKVTHEDSGRIVLAGDASDNSVIVISAFWTTWIIGLADTPVNERPGVLLFTPRGADEVVCELGAGNDSIYAYRLGAGTLDCKLGDGDDLLVLFGSRIGALTAGGGEGEDTIINLLSRVSESAAEEFESSFGF